MKSYPLRLSIALGAIILTGFIQRAEAVPTSINGTLSFSGTATTDTGNLATATEFLLFQDVFVGAESSLFGDYTGTSGASVALTPFSWDPPGPAFPIAPLWTFVSGGVTYSFELDSLHKDFASATGLLLSGYGTAFILGGGTDKLPTSGYWEFSAQTRGVATFTFSSTTQTPPFKAPDGGITAILLGAALLGFEVVKRKALI